ncbi:heavy metal translocating P-type ATPase [Bilifractor porci]|uniref:Cd(2+)-exporting ATPase n=1 Tax=Bilifractor porci TaxID=2606636 RepID=A0A7X2P948_9FIRM|nr:heavy metal translocating P-type ATPase [Bilifractor porci]MST82018.1 heavy metal translocating P-type ATPase [Bilifractor porci]
MNPKQKKLLIRILVAAVLYVPLLLISEGVIKADLPPVLLFLLFLVPYLITGYDVLWKAIRGIMKRQPFDEHFLMAIATVGAIILGEYPESVAVMLLYQVGEFFQSYAVGKSRRSISELMDIRPDYANIEGDDGQMERVDPDEVETGSIIVVQPGEKVPIDGVVVEGNSSMNTAALTGESMPREVGPDSTVLSGMINMSGVLKIRTTAEFEESTASKILELVENAASRKANAENFISKFARVYTPIVVYAAMALGIAAPVICMITGLGNYASTADIWKDWLLRACTFLVISCPCAFVISIPLSFFAGLGGAGSQGILIKGSNYLEVLAQVKTIAFDKTGTITKGNFAVAGVHHSPVEADRILEYAALAECHSSHPISASLQKAYGKAVDQTRVTDVQEISGHGVEAVIDGRVHVAVGNDRLMRKIGVEPIACHHIGTVIHVAVDGRYAGHILIIDELKEHAREAMSELKKAGVEKEVMLTGDIEKAAASVAQEVGLTDYRAGLLPADKVTVVEELLKEREGTGKKVAFVGDGINDAPVLARADIGIAMGALGSDAAIEAADVVLMNDDPLKISKAIRISKKCLRIVRQNIFFTLTVKIVCLVLGALGIANMWVAILADVGVMILAVLNAIRCLFVKNL